ncbi:WcbI family polysaccharide biosynthesis putative acetyltransferase [Sphingobium sp. AP49]|uniref:WcbI family polysaccharide biosynthesis putative acetyltransferase n=1 Tax=Sphingobium sp. AP49 TaxID=1144307 RepID=UPI0012F693EA|nr:WcbI family polysaccharide biosynthesis putative acetyltransferase [Sphingobium sp. AP49]WHO39986.1 WcbI family polysaccharide biosynthesis putative acetyltransferase [Sphingobium sp. AP49]
MSNVISAFQYYFGRYPENEDVIASHEGMSGGNFDAMRENFSLSEEYRQNYFTVTKPRNGTFFRPMQDGVKICVLGNCQGPNIAMAIASLAQAPVSVCGLEIMDFSETSGEMASIIKDADYVVACKTYNENYKSVSPDYIRSEYGKKTFEYSPVHFTGLQPDILVLGHYGQRIRGPLGDYNSRVVLSAFCRGMTVSECVGAFNEDTYQRAAYFAEFGWSRDTMLQREAALDEDGLRIADWFLDNIRRTPLLYSVNHPNSRVFAHFAQLILSKIGVPARRMPVDMIPNTLASQVIWPVAPELARANGVGYDTDLAYWCNNVMLNLDEMVWRSYKTYETLGRDFLIEAMGERAINFG